MRLTHIVIEGFRLFRDRTSIDLSSVGAAAIVGGNGVGKTSIVEAIEWALTGRARTDFVDEVISIGLDHADVTLSFEHGGVSYTLKRGRTRRTGTVSLEGSHRVWAGDEVPGALKSALGIEPEVLLGSAILRDGGHKAFTEAEPGDRRSTLARLLGVEWWTKAAASIGSELREAKREAAKLGNDLLADPEAKRSNLIAAKAMLEEAEAGSGRLEDAASAADADVAAARTADREAHAASSALNAKVGALKRAAFARASAERRVNKAAQDLASATTSLAMYGGDPDIDQAEARRRVSACQQARRDYDASTRQLETLTRMVASGACEGVRDDLACACPLLDASRLAEAEIEDLVPLIDKASQAAAGLADAELQMAAANAARRVADATLRLTEAEAELAGMSADQADDANDSVVQAAADAARAAADSLADALARRREAGDAIARVVGQVVDLRGRVDEYERTLAAHDQAQTKLDELSPDIVRLEAAAAIAKTAPVLLMEQVAIPHLEASVNEVLAELSPRGMQVELRTQRPKRRGGGYIETLDIIIRDDVGERSLKSYSSGERFRVNIAFSLAMSRMMSGHADVDAEFLIIDEGFGALDRDGHESIAEIFTALRAKYPLLLIVTHLPELADHLPGRIEVELGENGSLVSVR